MLVDSGCPLGQERDNSLWWDNGHHVRTYVWMLCQSDLYHALFPYYTVWTNWNELYIHYKRPALTSAIDYVSTAAGIVPRSIKFQHSDTRICCWNVIHVIETRHLSVYITKDELFKKGKHSFSKEFQACLILHIFQVRTKLFEILHNLKSFTLLPQ